MTTSPTTPPESGLTEARGATIIPFPVRQPTAAAEVESASPAEPTPTEPTPAERLARALAKLNAALAEQRQAVATFRSVMGDLKTSTAGLRDSLNRYNATLGALSNKVAGVHKQAVDLEQWANGALATHGTPDRAESR